MIGLCHLYNLNQNLQVDNIVWLCYGKNVTLYIGGFLK
jgi:hypothetical protein